MYESYEGDMLYKIIGDHFTETGNLDPEPIMDKILRDGIRIGLKSVQSRIDEFKKGQAYKNGTKDNTNG
jgi:hypothetical protein